MGIRPAGICWMREGTRERGRKGGDVRIIAGGWRRGECGSIRGECVRYSSTGGWTWTAAARRLPSLAKSAGGTEAERRGSTCRRDFSLSTAKRARRSAEVRRCTMWWSRLSPLQWAARRQKVDRVTDACGIRGEGINENYNCMGSSGSVQRLFSP